MTLELSGTKNIKWCGGHHFYYFSLIYIYYYGGADGMADCRKRDERKYNICKENGVKILYYATSSNIPESHFDTIYTNTNDLLKELKKMS